MTGPVQTPTDPGLLSPLEHDAIAMSGELWGMLCAITTDGPAREGDLRELIFHIHGIQRAVLKQAAARAYPELYRLLGGDPPPGPAQPAPPEMPDPLPDPVIPTGW